MSDPVVTVARFSNSLEAELVRNFLETHGISAHVTGDNVSTLNIGALGGLTQIYVRESDAERAAELLAEHFDKAELEQDWQDRVGDDTELWVCPICGGAISNEFDTCDACLTPRGAIQSKDGVLRRHFHWRQSPDPPDNAGIAKSTEKAPDIPQQAPESDHDLELDTDFVAPDIKLYRGDALASHAFHSALLGVLCGCLTCYSAFLLGQITIGKMELSAKGRYDFYLALAIVIAYFAIVIVFAFIASHHVDGAWPGQ